MPYLLILVLSLLLPTSGWAAIAFDAIAESTVGSAVSTRTFNVTITAGSNRLLVCGTAARGNSAANLVTSTVTHNSVGLTKIQETITADIGGAEFAGTSLWRLVAPTTGTLSVVVTWTGSVSNVVTAWCMSLTGVDQTSPIGNSGGASDVTGTSSTVSVAVNTTTTNSWVIDSVYDGLDTGMTVGAGQTSRSNRIVTGVSTDVVGASTEPSVSVGSVTMSWTTATPSFWATSAATVNEVQPATTFHGFSLLGVGN